MDSLIAATIVQRVGSNEEIIDRIWAERWKFGHDTAAFHFSVRPCSGLTDGLLGGSIGSPAGADGSDATPLPRCAIDNGIAAAMNKRRSARRFTGRAVTPESLSRVLFSMAGVTGYIDDAVFGMHQLSFAPSGGALNPYELYVIPRKVLEIPPATYHYNGLNHSLCRIGPYPDDAAALADDQQWASDAAFMTLLVAVLDRSWAKYPSSAGYANVLIEAGHRAQNALLMAADLELSGRMTTAIDDDIARRALQLARCEQAPIYLLAFGYE
jgi:SagB-type dehydrogenase family enzyme